MYGEDFLVRGNCIIKTGDGDDCVNLFYCGVCGDLAVLMGSGNDRLGPYFREVHVAGKADVDMGSGRDQVLLEDSGVLGNLVINTGAGDDSVEALGASIGGDLDISLDSHADMLEMGSLAVGGFARMDGGPDFDRLVDLGGNTFGGGPPKVTRFEIFGAGMDHPSLEALLKALVADGGDQMPLG